MAFLIHHNPNSSNYMAFYNIYPSFFGHPFPTMASRL
ncbi:Uncharacterized protein CTYZ_00001611, partial [Cryptosporidium tyzzeri]